MQSMGALFLTSYLEELERSSVIQQWDNNFVTLEEMKADPWAAASLTVLPHAASLSMWETSNSD